jgi:hypothetical protein
MGGAWVAVAALGTAEQAPTLAGDLVERLDDAEQLQPVGVHREAEPAARSGSIRTAVMGRRDLRRGEIGTCVPSVGQVKRS